MRGEQEEARGWGSRERHPKRWAWTPAHRGVRPSAPRAPGPRRPRLVRVCLLRVRGARGEGTAERGGPGSGEGGGACLACQREVCASACEPPPETRGERGLHWWRRSPSSWAASGAGPCSFSQVWPGLSVASGAAAKKEERSSRLWMFRPGKTASCVCAPARGEGGRRPPAMDHHPYYGGPEVEAQ